MAFFCFGVDGRGVPLGLRGGDLDGSLQELLTESMEELERQMASKEAETGGSRFWTREIFGSGGEFLDVSFGGWKRPWGNDFYLFLRDFVGMVEFLLVGWIHYMEELFWEKTQHLNDIKTRFWDGQNLGMGQLNLSLNKEHFSFQNNEHSVVSLTMETPDALFCFQVCYRVGEDQKTDSLGPQHTGSALYKRILFTALFGTGNDFSGKKHHQIE